MKRAAVHVRHAKLPDVAAQDEAEQQEQEPVQHRAAHDELEDGDVYGEQLGQRHDRSLSKSVALGTVVATETPYVDQSEAIWRESSGREPSVSA